MLSQALQTSSMNSTPVVYGRVEPRLWTPPLRELTEETSYGFDFIDFAEECGWPLDPWQKWLAVHMGELLPDGRPRFRIVLALVARQNGKTLLCRLLTLYWMFVERVPHILGTSTSRDTAKVSWREVVEMAEGIDLLQTAMDPTHTRLAIGEEAFFNTYGSEYRFAAPNRRAGRGSTIQRLILDELREHKDWETYNAAVKAMTAVADAQAVAITNQGDAGSIVLDSLRDSALEYIDTGVGDPRLGLFEWSAPNGADPTDPEALAMANPNLGDRVQLDSIMGDAMRARKAGGAELAGFRTETLCQRVTTLDAAIDEEAWALAGATDPVDLAEHRDKLALCYDVAPEGTHATLVAAATLDGITHVEVVKVWTGFGCTKALRAELPGLVERLRPRTVGNFPGGPAAAVAVDLAGRKGRSAWPPRRVTLVELTSETPAVCMGLAELVTGREIQHPDDPMLTEHVNQTQRLRRGAEGQWIFTRRGTKPVDGTYALAGAVYLAKTLPAAPPRFTVARVGE